MSSDSDSQSSLVFRKSKFMKNKKDDNNSNLENLIHDQTKVNKNGFQTIQQILTEMLKIQKLEKDNINDLEKRISNQEKIINELKNKKHEVPVINNVKQDKPVKVIDQSISNQSLQTASTYTNRVKGVEIQKELINEMREDAIFNKIEREKNKVPSKPGLKPEYITLEKKAELIST